MAGKFRRKFIDIISDRVTEHYQGKVAEKELQEQLGEIQKHIVKLELCKKKVCVQRTENLRKLKRLPLEKLNELLMSQKIICSKIESGEPKRLP